MMCTWTHDDVHIHRAYICTIFHAWHITACLGRLDRQLKALVRQKKEEERKAFEEELGYLMDKGNVSQAWRCCRAYCHTMKGTKNMRGFPH
eukprot:6831912-Karenia_brevis.AAC.1